MKLVEKINKWLRRERKFYEGVWIECPVFYLRQFFYFKKALTKKEFLKWCSDSSILKCPFCGEQHGEEKRA
jgi:hypothetical protein